MTDLSLRIDAVRTAIGVVDEDMSALLRELTDLKKEHDEQQMQLTAARSLAENRATRIAQLVEERDALHDTIEEQKRRIMRLVSERDKAETFAGGYRYAEWPIGTRVRKIKGSSWQGKVVGFYTTAQTAAGYCVESEREPGSVQIYPKHALEVVRD